MEKPPVPVFVITGANGGIGRAFATLFRAKGYHLSLLTRNVEDLKTVFGPEGDFLQYVEYNALNGDAIDYKAPERCVELVIQKFKHITCLINNAGASSRVNAMDGDAKGFERDFLINALSPMLLMRACMPHLEAAAKQQGSATPRIINIGSLSGGGRIRSSASASYAASKGTLGDYSYSMAAYCEESKNGVEVVHLILGDVNTPMSQRSKLSPEDKIQPQTVAEKIDEIFRTPREVKCQTVMLLNKYEPGL